MCKSLSRISLCLSLTLFSSFSAFADTISVSPSSLASSVGSTVSLAVDVNAINSLYAYQFDIRFDPLIIQAIGPVTEGAFLSSGGVTSFLPGSIDNNLGTISFVGGSLIGLRPGISGSGTLSNLQFKIVADGSSPVALENVVLLNASLSSISVPIQNGVITTAAPEPSVPSLFVVGMLLLAGSGYKRKVCRRKASLLIK